MSWTNVDRLRRAATTAPATPAPTPRPAARPQRVTAPVSLDGVNARVEQVYAAWCKAQGVKPTPLAPLPTASATAPRGAGDPRRAEINPNWILIGDQWCAAPLSTRGAVAA